MNKDWPVESLVHHRGDMLFLDRVVQYSDTSIECEANTSRQSAFAKSEKGIPAWLGLEYMCQTIAALEGIRRLQKNEPILLSFVMGSRKITSEKSYLPLAEIIRIRAVNEVRDDTGVGVYGCEVRLDDERIIHGVIKGYMPKSTQAIFETS